MPTASLRSRPSRSSLALSSAAALLIGCASPIRAQPLPVLANERIPCLIEAPMRVKVSASVQGLVESIKVDRGDRVKAGQILVEMEASVEKAQLAIAARRAANSELVASAEARFNAARRSFERFQRLRQTNAGALTVAKFDEAEMEAAVADANLRDARSNLESARLESARAQSLLDLRTIRSPVDGVVIERVMAPGEYRNEQAHFLTIATINPLHVEAYLPAVYYTQVVLGGIAEVFPAAPLGGVRSARVIVIDPVIDAPSGSFGVRLELANADYAIPAGLRCEIRFGAAKR